MNCWNSKSQNATRQSAAKPQTLLRKVQRLMGLASVLCNTILASDTVTLMVGDDIVQTVGKPMELLQLHAAGAPMPFNYVGNSKQIWGAKGIQGLIVATSTSVVADNPISTEMLANGFVGKLAGVNIYFSQEVTEDGNNDCPAGMFSKNAIGLGISSAGLLSVEQQRDASYQHTEYVASLKCGVIEIQDTFGVYMLTDVA